MRLTSSLILNAVLCAAVPPVPRQQKPPAFFLAGDSTTASNGGWGDAFLTVLEGGATGQNEGRSGATTVSYINGEGVELLQGLVTDNTDDYDCYVTLQFGHNDQASTANITMDQFQSNLQFMSEKITAAGGTPIILTPLTRRTFTNGTLDDSLANVSEASRKAAQAAGVPMLDLNAASKAYVQAIGSSDADTYNLAFGDWTHLNEHGATVFARIVADLVEEWRLAFDGYITPDEELSEKIKEGIYA
ncbi:SGNH hydrolase-type esterase domain-containing protein [Dichotomopilus funicola]|uniref:SGNH hydrolase-type esterase domain-containing protein n=1 Tax=Dichotomopilus funicola TaxID=1934379 RepID=A0AAN6V2T6_9PEZI|nr:SGNH hydrolase-type esterase domain-containing protein [Dichotomopilus funicola]